MADRTPSDLADRLVQHCVNDPHARGLPQMQADMHAAAALLREQADQLDTLRAAIGDPDELRGHELDMSDGTVNTPEVTHEIVRDILLRIAAAVEHTQEGT